MPTTTSILQGLRLASNDAIGVSIAWHVVTLSVLIALGRRWRPSNAKAGALLATPIASASIIAFVQGNPFNGGLLGALAIVLVGLSSRLDSKAVKPVARTTTLIGAAMVGFGWLYPHFLESRPSAMYLFAAPMGVIPCPTLSVVTGFALLAGGLESRAWSLTLSTVGLFYGVFGFVRLDVGLDLVLVAGAATLFVSAIGAPRRRVKAGDVQRGERVLIRS